MKDSLDFVSYYRIALWLSGRVDSTLVRLQKRTQESNERDSRVCVKKK
jgi:hypothetical protein